MTLYDQVIVIRERLVNSEGRRELANNLATAYMNKANAVMALGDNRAAVTLYDQAIAIYERLVNDEGRRELANYLAGVYMNKANAVGILGDNRACRDAVRPGHRPLRASGQQRGPPRTRQPFGRRLYEQGQRGGRPWGRPR